MPTRIASARRGSARLIAVSLGLFVACGSSDETNPPTTPALDGAVDSAIAADASDDPKDSGPATATTCFTADPGEASCKAACTPYEGCPMPGFTVACAGAACATGGSTRAELTKCFESSGGNCAKLKQCFGCVTACSYLDDQNCPQAAELPSCCSACLTKPDCYDGKLGVCQAVASCK